MPLRALDPKSEFGTHRHTFALRNQGFLLVRYVWNRPQSVENGHKFGHTLGRFTLPALGTPHPPRRRPPARVLPACSVLR